MKHRFENSRDFRVQGLRLWGFVGVYGFGFFFMGLGFGVLGFRVYGFGFFRALGCLGV